MSKSPPSAVAEQLPRQVVLIDILRQQILDLEALRKEVAEAEKRAAGSARIIRNPAVDRLSSAHAPNPSNYRLRSPRPL